MNLINSSLIPVALILLISCQNKQRQASGAALVKGNKTTAVEVVNPSKNTFTASVLIAGTAMPDKHVRLHAMESGFVKSIPKDIGDAVKKGALIAKLENPEVQQLLKRTEAELERAKANLMKAEARLLKAQALEKAAAATSGRISSIFGKTPSLTPAALVEQSQAEAEAARAEVDIAKAEVEAAKKDVAAREAEKAAASLRRDMLCVRAPFTGIVTQRFVDMGAAVQNGLSGSKPMPLVELQAVNPIRLVLPLPESDAAAVKPGMPASVSFPELPGKAYQARVSRTSRAIDPASGTMQVELDLPNPKGTILPGMYARVSMEISSREGVLSLPVEAQLIDQDEYFLLLVNNGKVERIPLKKGLSGKTFFEVLNAGISESSQVIVQGKGLVKPGQIVEPVLKKN